MKLDSNEQRTLLKQCIAHTVVNGEVESLLPFMDAVARLINSIDTAELEPLKGTPDKEPVAVSDTSS